MELKIIRNGVKLNIKYKECVDMAYRSSSPKTYANYMLETVFTSFIIDLSISCLLVVVFCLHNGDVVSKMENKKLVKIGT